MQDTRQSVPFPAKPMLRMSGRAIRWRDQLAFPNIDWSWWHGQQWGVVGANGSGKSLLALAVWGKASLVEGGVDYAFEDGTPRERPWAAAEPIVLLSPDDHRDLALQESSFYQSRWQSGLEEGSRTIADLLSYRNVMGINPFEVGVSQRTPPGYQKRLRELLQWFGLEALRERKLNGLSNGEMRKILLVHALLRQPRLLILDDPFGGLDVEARRSLKVVLNRLMEDGLSLLLLTSRPDELPERTSHLLLASDYQIIDQGDKTRILKHPLARTLIDPGTNPGRLRACTQVSFPSQRASRSPLLEMRQVTIQVGRKRILKDLSWTIWPGEHWVLLGPNGSGKTTLLSLIQGDHPQSYAIDLKLFGSRLQNTQAIWRIRQKCGWLSPELHLHYPPGWTCWQVVCSGYYGSLGLYQSCTPRQRQRARNLLETFLLEDEIEEPFGALSLGDQRMILLARAMINHPRLLILDEPCQGLDAHHRQVLLDQVDRQVAENDTSLIFVTHHAQEIPTCITHVIRMRGGRLLL